jgi:6-phosphogluconolactonase
VAGFRDYSIVMPTRRTIKVLANAGDLFHAAAQEFVRVGRLAIGGHGRFSVALSGGSTPKSLYAHLASNYADFPWNRTFLFFGDERHVPPTDRESNYLMVKETLLSKITIPVANVFRVQGESPDAAAAAGDYEAQLKTFFELKAGEFPRFDLILLGLGPDGHTASLFPDSEGLKEETRLVIANRVEKFKTDRITFTFPVLNHATEAMFLVSGADKAEIVQQVLEGKGTPPYPSQQVQPAEGSLLWMIDEPAASKLKR